jgi:hypothetical protein
MRAWLYLGLSLSGAACAGSNAKADLENVRAAHSLLAEWALVAETPAAAPYAAQMRAEAVRQLAATAAAARSSGSPAGATIADIASLPEDAPADLVRQRAAAAGRLENRLAAR